MNNLFCHIRTNTTEIATYSRNYNLFIFKLRYKKTFSTSRCKLNWNISKTFSVLFMSHFYRLKRGSVFNKYPFELIVYTYMFLNITWPVHKKIDDIFSWRVQAFTWRNNGVKVYLNFVCIILQTENRRVARAAIRTIVKIGNIRNNYRLATRRERFH